MESDKPELRALRVEVATKEKKATKRQVQEAIEKRLASEPTDLFEKFNNVVLLVQHQQRGTPDPECDPKVRSSS